MTIKEKPVRARDLGLDFPGRPGTFNAITDVDGVLVGLRTIVEDAPRPGRQRLVRTGVTAILPRPAGEAPRPVWAGFHRFNGNGEMTGIHWIEDGGLFPGPVLITNTHAVGIAHHAAVKWMLRTYRDVYEGDDHHLWLMPVVAETYDGVLNDINGQPVGEEDVLAALAAAAGGPVSEGNTGGGTGMICYEFKGGTGTASRRFAIDGQEHTLGVLVQANHGVRDWLSILGVPVGRHLTGDRLLESPGERGSIIVVVATDVPLAPHQLKRVARRAAIGIGRGGTVGGNNSGDMFLAFSTANEMPLPHRAGARMALEILNDEHLDAVYEAAVQSVEEAVVNAMVAARDMGGTEWDRPAGRPLRVAAIDHEALAGIMRRYGRPG